MNDQLIQKLENKRIINLIEQIILWLIRRKSPITFVGKNLMRLGFVFLSPSIFLEIFKFLFVNLFEESLLIKYIIKYDTITLILGLLSFFFGCLILFLNYCKYFDKYLLNKKIIIKQYSMGPPIFNNLIDLKEKYNVIEYDINLIKFLDPENFIPKKIIKGIKYQDKICKKILSFKTNTKIENFTFCSIASLPFVARLGAKLGNEQSLEFYENDQIEKDGFFKLENKYFSKQLEVKDRKIENTEELVLTIGITKSINRDSIPDIFSNYDYINIEHPEATKLPSNRDAINSSKQLTEYRDFIKSEIIKLDKVKVIHILYSGQTSLMFLLISSFNRNYEKYKIIVYHFYDGKYIWGMDIYQNNASKALVYL